MTIREYADYFDPAKAAVDAGIDYDGLTPDQQMLILDSAAIIIWRYYRPAMNAIQGRDAIALDAINQNCYAAMVDYLSDVWLGVEP